MRLRILYVYISYIILLRIKSSSVNASTLTSSFVSVNNIIRIVFKVYILERIPRSREACFTFRSRSSPRMKIFYKSLTSVEIEEQNILLGISLHENGSHTTDKGIPLVILIENEICILNPYVETRNDSLQGSKDFKALHHIFDFKENRNRFATNVSGSNYWNAYNLAQKRLPYYPA